MARRRPRSSSGMPHRHGSSGSGLPARLVDGEGGAVAVNGWPAPETRAASRNPSERIRRRHSSQPTTNGRGTDLLPVPRPLPIRAPARGDARCSTRSCGSPREAPAPSACCCSRPASCFGLVTVTRFQNAELWPRFFNYEMHRRVSLLSIAFLAVHVAAAIFDPFTSLGLGAALVPLASSYRPVPVALGVVALYLFVALIATSLLRKHVGQKAWRAIHWASYAMWPLALIHGITAGTDALALWMLGIDALCVTAVALALAWRILPRDTARPGAAPDDDGSLSRCGCWWPKTTRACARSSSSAWPMPATRWTPSSAATTPSTTSSGTSTTSPSSTGGCRAPRASTSSRGRASTSARPRS